MPSWLCPLDHLPNHALNLHRLPPPQILVALTAADGSRHQLAATVVAKDPSRELMVLSVVPPPAGLQPITAGSSVGLRVGQDAFLLGALPGGASPSITTGGLLGMGFWLRSPGRAAEIGAAAPAAVPALLLPA
jgi:S1-C subfamily serine protease